MSEIRKFIFDGLPVRGVLVRLHSPWLELLQRRASGGAAGAYAEPVQNMLGELLAAAALMHSSIKFKGSLILQIFGAGPVKLAVAEVQPDFGLRATATVIGEIASDATLSAMVNRNNRGKCAITLDPKDKFPGQQAYQGIVPLLDDAHEKLEKLSEVLEHYMRQSEQLDTTLVLAANEKVAAGLLLQRLPRSGAGNLAGHSDEDEMGFSEDYRRIAMLASSLKRDELMTLDADTILRRLFWQEKVICFEPVEGDPVPHFHCTCSRARVEKMLLGLGAAQAQSILVERGEIEVGCEFCGARQRFDSIDVAQVFKAAAKLPSKASNLH